MSYEVGTYYPLGEETTIEQAHNWCLPGTSYRLRDGKAFKVIPVVFA